MPKRNNTTVSKEATPDLTPPPLVRQSAILYVLSNMPNGRREEAGSQVLGRSKNKNR